MELRCSDRPTSATLQADLAHYNFAAGPSMLPRSVLSTIQAELGTDDTANLLEVPFSSPRFGDVLATAESDLRTLLGVPDDFAVLFLQGGASAHFALVPLNLLAADDVADYVETGYWASRAMQEASRYCRVNCVASSANASFDRVPEASLWRISSRAGYLHLTSNDTACGVQFPSIPLASHAPIVADMSSDLLTRRLDVSTCGLIYASAQKNLGAAGLTILIVRRTLLGRARSETPAVFDYGRQAQAGSRINTPPMFAVYVAGLMFRWIREQGGVVEMERRAIERSASVYSVIDASEGFYRCPVQAAFRSRANVCFDLRDPRLLPRFLDQAQLRGLYHLAGHARVGGVRASLYNAMPLAGARALAAFMRDFMKRNG